MSNRILFIVLNGEIKFLQNSAMDHREWYQSLGGSMEEYENVIRGYIMDGMIIFFKANLNYDDEVITFASKMGLKMREQLNQPDLKICCGIDPGHDGAKWEPILILQDTDLVGFKTEEQLQEEQKKQERQAQLQALQAGAEQGPIVEFKNDYEDPKFIKYATKFTLIMIVLAFVLKLIMIHNKTFLMSNRWNTLLLFAQMGGFIFSIIGFNKKLSKTKYAGVLASITSIFLFDLGDIIIGIIYFLFTIDHNIIINGTEGIKTGIKKIKEKTKKTKV